MCGIAGFHGTPDWDADHRAVLAGMVAAVRHRGPDEQGCFLAPGVGLGHARLSILDLAGGRQPMADEAGDHCVTFNGEIFNYLELQRDLRARGRRVRTGSDTEVILHAYAEYGVRCVEEFNGDFAFALWDKARDRLFIARDRMGVRPVYYTRVGGVLVFASEVKALLRVPGVRAELDPVALDQCFTFWFPLAPRTPYQGISELPPGHYLVSEGGQVTVRPYWQLRFPDAAEHRAGPRADGRAVAEELHDLLVDATRIRLRADVPVGAYLSGGFDSSAVAALVKTFTDRRLCTFSVGFESPEFDETAQQQEVVRSLGTEHASVVCTAASIGAAFPDVIRHAERPVLRTAPAPLFRLSRLVRDSGFKVVLTGEGADEVFGGYDIFKEAKVRRFWARCPNSTSRPRLLRRLYPYLPGIQGQSQAYLEAFFRTGLTNPHDPFFSHRPRWQSTAATKAFFSADLAASLKGYDAVEDLRGQLPADFGRWHPLCRAQYLEACHLLPGYILSSQGDRVGMAHAVEGRFPFLDHRVVEFAARIPPRLRLKGMTEKHILRESVGRYLPPAIARRPKQPYRAPDSQSFFGPAAPEYVAELLGPAAVARGGYFDPAAVAKLVKKCRAGAAVSLRDNMALVGILSVQLLDHLFVRGAAGLAPAA
ncbi:asparagine synthase (glutamine-hydrolyzing) [Urbifossiella limnaea]|uniref:asparagine synthase (glutamine-hydrolyzing) n=1 Tax=Urbifossiella limnaea TaxID=2528023 RepID=A0A517Y395_9BACT|nr:asparagine synthase (glutamine-hydrolyzing) [Urbifossiella limnaea]QDU24188.1 Asparagine synthetase [glutamine-hydrolyzing] 1 [Urbifossiella limnaea]